MARFPRREPAGCSAWRTSNVFLLVRVSYVHGYGIKRLLAWRRSSSGERGLVPYKFLCARWICSSTGVNLLCQLAALAISLCCTRVLGYGGQWPNIGKVPDLVGLNMLTYLLDSPGRRGYTVQRHNNVRLNFRLRFGHLPPYPSITWPQEKGGWLIWT